MGLGSCEGEPDRIFKALEGGASPEPRQTQKSEGGPDGQIVVEAENLGDVGTSGPVTITDTLPAGLTAVAANAFAGKVEQDQFGKVGCVLASAGKQVTCTSEKGSVPAL